MYQMSLEMKKKMLKIKCGAECIESIKCSQRRVKEKKILFVQCKKSEEKCHYLAMK